jgi:hypothetical protein
VLVCHVDESLDGEWVELFDAYDRGAIFTNLGALCDEIPVDLAGTEDHSCGAGNGRVINQGSKCS